MCWGSNGDSSLNDNAPGPSGEKVLGGLEVETHLNVGSEHLFLLFTGNRMLFVHLAKVGKASMTLSNLLGKFSSGLVRVPGKSGRLNELAQMEPETILGLDPDNFWVEYGQVVSLSIERGEWERLKITLVTADTKFELFGSLVPVEGLRDLMSSLLSDKLSFRS